MYKCHHWISGIVDHYKLHSITVTCTTPGKLQQIIYKLEKNLVLMHFCIENCQIQIHLFPQKIPLSKIELTLYHLAV